MTSRIHRMPFGAEVQPDGRVRFRLWAPGARKIELVLPEQGSTLEMQPLPEGWYELTTDRARAGTLYQYRIDGDLTVPDPASRSNPQDVHGPSKVVDPAAFEWHDEAWNGRPWHQAVVYELHVGTFTPQGTFASVESRLDHLQSLGVTAIELMPIAEFPGARNWGYDGVLPFAPDAAYGTPEDLKRLIVAAHKRNMMVLLDVVYNHFGPDGNYLHTYARAFFTDRHRTPWGEAINFDDKQSRIVRDFFIHNALYWLEEYHFDGLRFDAVHAVRDDSVPDIFTEISQRVRAHFARERNVHLVLENVNNEAYRLTRAPADPGRFEAQWNDDMHHCMHLILTGERDGYYGDYTFDPHRLLGRCLAEGFAYQGEISRFHRNRRRGEPSAGLPPTCFVDFLQNHDQIGNRALGERLTTLVEPGPLKAAAAVLLLSPHIPLLFMGEEWGAREPFLFFCDFGPDLAQAVREGRRREFARFEKFAGGVELPDPNDPATARQSMLDWSVLSREEEAAWLAYYKELLSIRHRDIVPLLPGMRSGHFEILDHRLLEVHWPTHDGHTLTLAANLSPQEAKLPSAPSGRVLYFTGTDPGNTMPPWSVLCTVQERLRY